MKLEHTILNELIVNEKFNRKVIAYLKEDYFEAPSERLVLELVTAYMDKYNALPTKQALEVELDAKSNVRQEIYSEAKEFIDAIAPSEQNFDWIVDTTEQFCKDRAVYLALMESIQIVDQAKTGNVSVGAIPGILSDALAVSFDVALGHDYMEDIDARFEYYNTPTVKIPFDLDLFNRSTDGGIARKTLTMFLAGTGVGKSMMMCHMAAANLRHGLNVLYFSMEMSDLSVSTRIDANLFGIPTKQLTGISKEKYYGLVEKMRNKASGKLVVKEYPTSQAGANHFRYFISELKQKKGFVPDVIYVDYLNICSSSRMKMGGSVNSYTYIKSIAEELRGLAVETNTALVSATQTNRDGYNNSDAGLENTSESFGVPATADIMFALIDTGELKELNQIMVKKLKHRTGDLAHYGKFLVGVDRSTMTLYDVNGSDELADVPPPEAKSNKKKDKFQNFS